MEYWKIGMLTRMVFMEGLPAIGWRDGRWNAIILVTLRPESTPFATVGMPFLRSESPGLVFSTTYLRGSFAPSAFPALNPERDRGFIRY